MMTTIDLTEKDERALLVGVNLPNSPWDIEESMAELGRLTESAGGIVSGAVIQSRSRPDPRTFIGSGKAEEIRMVAEEDSADIVIFDDELSPAQARNLEDLLGRRVIDRTQLILDIFAQRAETKEGKLQVELAQLQYILPRLTGFGISLSRQGAGIGTRGPGETKLETDRRRIRTRMAEIRRNLDDVVRHRDVQRTGRRASMALTAALVGYTNAGKSTLINRLTGADMYADDRLFATLDPTMRATALPRGGSLLVVDTVGFIRKLPHDLVVAFRATLEEVVRADILIHVVDISSSDWYDQSIAVFEVLEQLGAAEMPTVTAFNKTDLVGEKEIETALMRTPYSVAISAVTGAGMDELLRTIEQINPEPIIRSNFLFPYDEGRLVAWVHEHGHVIGEQYVAEGIKIEADLRRDLAQRVSGYRT